MAEELDISAPTFTQHLRIAQQKLLALLFTV
ncbi:helix-turn-helix domain-containing protein [Halorussus sp. AFM4]